MQRTRQRDTRPEIQLRSALHRMGLRFRVDAKPLADSRRRADIVFRRARVAVFVDGCFWHGCPIHGTIPKANRDWWVEKLKANRARDETTDAALEEAGWLSVRVWEHEQAEEAAEAIAALVRQRAP